MSTIRNNPGKKLAFNEIISCYEYTREPIKHEYIWNKEYIEEGRELTDIKVGESLMHFIPKEVRWKIEEDIDEGALMMANHFNKTVTIDYDDMERSELPKEALEQYIHGGSGPFERTRYTIGLPQIKSVTSAISDSVNDPVKIRLVIRPNKDHYLHSAEMHKRKVHDYCQCCIIHASKAITVGAGDKSSRKTKGRSKREKVQLFYASKGASL